MDASIASVFVLQCQSSHQGTFGITIMPHGVTPILAVGLTGVDYAVLAIYLIATVLVGTLTGKDQNSLDEYCLAGRRIPWWAACVSIVATDLSGISYMGVPAWVYDKDLKYFAGVFLMPLVMLCVALIFVPIFFRIGVYTIYQYLESRFHANARTVTAVLFIFKGFVHIGGAIYIPSLALTAVTGIPLWLCIVIVGVSTTLYTMTGGMHAVIWTDLLQFVVLFGGLVLMILLGMSYLHWDWRGVWHTAGTLTGPVSGTPHTTLMNWHFDLHTEATVWSLLAFWFIYNLGTYGTDQIAVQRYLTVKSFRELFKSVMGSSFVNIFSVCAMALLGIVLVVFYHDRPDLARTLPRSDMIVPHFVIQVLPAGARGTIFAAIFAATMSCVSAGLNSISTVGAVDIYQRHFRKNGSPRHYLRVAQLMTLLAGFLTTAAALWIGTATTTVLQTINSLASLFIAPITAMFLLGVLTRRANVGGLIVGVLAGITFGSLIQWGPLGSKINWLWMAPLGCMITFIVGYISSFAFRGQLPTQASPHECLLSEVHGVSSVESAVPRS